jgi:H+/Cl- antiporter ClcA
VDRSEPTPPDRPAAPAAPGPARRTVDRLRALAHDTPRPDPAVAVRLVRHLARWIALAGLVGVVSGVASAALLRALRWATDTRADHPWLLALLPVGGLAVGLLYHYLGGRADEGNNLVLDEIHESRDRVPELMAPFVFIGNTVTVLFGGSVGREGTALQMSASLADTISRILRLDDDDRRTMLVAALAGGFGGVFGVPLAGAVFAIEVQARGRLRTDTLVPCLTASVVADLVVRGLGIRHGVTPTTGTVDLTWSLAGKVALAGIAFALVATLFVDLTHGLTRLFGALIPWKPGRPVLGGLCVIGLTLLVGNQTYNGLSLPLLDHALRGQPVGDWAFLLKLVFTAVTLGALFKGGEVTPLFVIGATLGATLAGVLGVPVTLLAALGYVAVFAAASNTPLACTIMGVELFGAGALPYFAIACVVAYACAPPRGIYRSQRVAD